MLPILVLVYYEPLVVAKKHTHHTTSQFYQSFQDPKPILNLNKSTSRRELEERSLSEMQGPLILEPQIRSLLMEARGTQEVFE